jgi:hypothetical protein
MVGMIKDNMSYNDINDIYSIFMYNLKRFFDYHVLIKSKDKENLKFPPTDLIAEKISKYLSLGDMIKFSSLPLIKYSEQGDSQLELTKEVIVNLAENDTNTFIENGLKAVDVSSDGNCFFHAVERQLEILNDGQQIMNYQELRELSIQYIRGHPEEIQDFLVNETIEEYVDRISQNGQWADHPLIAALARQLGVDIVIINNNHIDQPHVIAGAEQQGRGIIYLGHLGEAHYVSLEPADGEGSTERFQELQEQVIGILSQQSQELSEPNNNEEMSSISGDYFIPESPLSILDSDYTPESSIATTSSLLLGAYVLSISHD